MSQIIKFQEGGKVEQKFFTYPKGKIETDRLIKAISTNLDNYLNEQSWNKKRQQRFLNSVDKFINGIKNGSVSNMSEIGRFEDASGTLNDNTGTRHFKEDQEAATFVKWVLDAQKPFEEQSKDSIQNTPFNINTEFAKSFNKDQFSTESDVLDPNLLYGISHTLTKPNQAFNVVLSSLKNINPENWGSIFQNKETYLSKLNQIENEALQLARKNKLTNELAKSYLSKLGINGAFYDYLTGVDPNAAQPSQDETTVEPSKEPVEPKNNSDQTTQPREQQAIDNLKNILWNSKMQNWWNVNKNKYYTLNNSNQNKKYYEYRLLKSGNGNQYLTNLFKQLINLNLDKGLNATLTTTLPSINNGITGYRPETYNRAYGDALKYLTENNKTAFVSKLDDGVNYLILPTLTRNSKYVVIYNKNNHRLMRIPAIYLLNDSKNSELFKKTYLSNNSLKSNDLGIVIPFKKEGGVLKGQEGFKIPYDKVKWDLETRYRNKYDNNKLFLEPRNKLISNSIHPENNQYDPEVGGKILEETNWYNDWINQLTTNNKLAEKWANDYLNQFSEKDYKLKNLYKNSWFNNDKFNFNSFKNYVSSKGLPLWKDGINGAGHDVYKGKLYRIKGTNTYDSLENLINQGYSLINNSIKTDNPLIDIYEVDKSANTYGQTKNSSHVTAGTIKNKKIEDNWRRDLPTITGSLARFYNTSQGNKKLLNEALSALKPYLKEPKRFDRNIYGDYGALSQSEQNAQKLNTIASKTISSDASLDQLSKLEGEKQASEYRMKGQLANSDRIKQTLEAALAQSKENVYNNIDTSNENRYNEWNNNILRSQVKQGYIQKNTENLNNLISEFQNLAQTRQNESLELNEAAINEYLRNKYDNNPELNALKSELNQFITSGGEVNSWPRYNEYIALVKRLNQEKIKELLELKAKNRNLDINKYLISTNITPIQISQKGKGGNIDKIEIAKIKDKLNRQKLFQKNLLDYNKLNNKSFVQLSSGMQKLLSQVIK